jgi:hypothetical protein
MDIVVWLRSLGLGKYEAAFRENEIDETVLPGLTAEDLKELGVTALGHRRKLLDAIAALRNDTSSAQGPSSDLKTAPGGCIGAAWHRRYRHACHLRAGVAPHGQLRQVPAYSLAARFAAEAPLRSKQ